MKRLRKQLSMLLMLTLLVGFTACQDDDEIFDRIVGRTWVGDLGFESESGVPLKSFVFLGGDGFGTDELVFMDNGGFAQRLNITWSIENSTIYIGYGNVAAPREIRNVYVSSGRITGDVYIDGRPFKTGSTFRVN